LKLLGHYMSPYTRRIAVSLNFLGTPFELVEVSVMREPERVRPHNPVLRIPTVLLDDGEPLIESGAILDEIDQWLALHEHWCREAEPKGVASPN
jgi:glutathione S-transferase